MPLSTVPVLVRANFDEARIWGIEHTARRCSAATSRWTTAFTYLHARDTTTDLPPNIEGGTPAPDAFITLRWTSANGRWWVEPYTHFAWEQSNLSTLDLGDRRTGAGRSRGNIASFFTNGARARGSIGPGADNVAGTADDVLIATGETVAQIENRVLGVGVNSAALHRRAALRAPSACALGYARRRTKSSSTSRISTTRTTEASAGASTHRGSGCRSSLWISVLPGLALSQRAPDFNF